MLSKPGPLAYLSFQLAVKLPAEDWRTSAGLAQRAVDGKNNEKQITRQRASFALEIPVFKATNRL